MPSGTVFMSRGSGNDDDDSTSSKKDVIFLRHSITHMNEYLGSSLSFGAPGFTDIFPDAKQYPLFHDTPLSPRGIRLAQQSLAAAATATRQEQQLRLHNLDLIVVSPLRRALQTLDIGLVQPQRCTAKTTTTSHPRPLILAQPLAAERVYLISDIGRPASVLEQEFPYVDFTELKKQQQHHPEGKWWWTPSSSSYTEWRPTGRGQSYACPGEPSEDFERRMTQLYYWLKQRPEQTILVVCHHGVIDWMLDMDFDNCQWKKVPFESLRPRNLVPMTTTTTTTTTN